MRVLIYGAGVIGSIYAVQLSQIGCQISVYARGRRLVELKENGLRYRKNKQIQCTDVTVLEHLQPNDCFDYIFLTVRAEQLNRALEELRENISPTIVTMVNSLDDYAQWEDICGKGRILPAFPGAGGSIRNGILEAALTPGWIQPTTFAEINGIRSERCRILKEMLTRAGVPCQIVPDMHAWQVCHLAMVVPLADAYYMADDSRLVHKNRAVMRRTAQTLHDNFAKLKERGDAISPVKLNLFHLCPVWMMSVILPFVYNSSFGDMFMYQHAIKAEEEMKQLHNVFYGYLYREV